MALTGEVNPRGLRHAQKIHSAMLEEPAIFDGEHSVPQYFRNFFVLDDLPLGSLSRVEQRSDHDGLEFVSVEVTGVSGDALHLPAANLHRGRFRAVIRGRPGLDLDAAAAQQPVAAKFSASIAVGVACLPQLCGDFGGADFLTYTNGLWDSVDFRGIAENLSFKTMLDDAVVLDVVVGKY